MNVLGPYLLDVVIFLPVVGAAVLLVAFRSGQGTGAARFATGVAALDLLVGLQLWFAWADAPRDAFGFRFVREIPWVESLGVSYVVGVDGISMLLVLLTAGLGFLAILASWTAVRDRVAPYYATLLLLQSALIGIFVSLDLVLFCVFWEALLIPASFVVGVWGGERRIYAAVKFFLVSSLGSVLMLLGIVALYLHHGARTQLYTFDLRVLQSMGNWNGWGDLQLWVWLAFFVAFASRVPLFPFHTWLPDTQAGAPTAAAVLFAGVLLKTGVYGFVRFSVPMLPDATREFLPWVLGVSVVGVLWAATIALVQTDWTRLLAYASVSQLGLATLGVFALNEHGMTGGLLQLVNHGLSTGALFLLVGMIDERRSTGRRDALGGARRATPVLGALVLLMVLSSIGVPALPGNGFVGELAILVGLFRLDTKLWAMLGTAGIAIGAIAMVRLYRRTMVGVTIPGPGPREIAAIVPLVVLSFWIGLYPKPFLALLEDPVSRLVRQVEKIEVYPSNLVRGD